MFLACKEEKIIVRLIKNFFFKKVIHHRVEFYHHCLFKNIFISIDVFHKPSKSKKITIHREISSANENKNEHDEPKLQSINQSFHK